MNLTILKKSRHSPTAGDIFAMKPRELPFIFGRVIRTDANPLGVGDGILVYVYDARSRDRESVPELSQERLLVPPIITNKLPWSRGYFEHISSGSTAPSDVLAQHCFKDIRGWYFDEFGRRLSGPVEPVGQWGLHSYRTIDDELSEALGLPRAEEDGQ